MELPRSPCRRFHSHARRRQRNAQGLLGEVLQESAQAALSYVRSHAEELKIPPNILKEKDKNLPLVKNGWSLKPSFMIQAGRSLQGSDGIMMNKAKTQELTVPDHDVVRFGILIEAVRELGQLTLRLDVELLELFEDEFVAVLDGDDGRRF